MRWPDEAACAALATAWSRRAALRDATVELDGALGAGKTTFVRHLLRALGVVGRIKSPTFAVLEPYELPDGTAVSHFDFYRFDAAADTWDDAGLRERFAAPGLKLSEWAAHAGASLPRPDLRLTITVDEEVRPRGDAAGAGAGVRVRVGVGAGVGVGVGSAAAAGAGFDDPIDAAPPRTVRADAFTPRGAALLW